MVIDRSNFYEDTFANYKEASAPEREADYVSLKRRIVFVSRLKELGLLIDYEWDYDIDGNKMCVYDAEGNTIGNVLEIIQNHDTKEEGYVYELLNEASSKYWFTKEGVYRQSDHWGTCRSCEWHLNTDIPRDRVIRTGFIKWKEFYKIA